MDEHEEAEAALKDAQQQLRDLERIWWSLSDEQRKRLPDFAPFFGPSPDEQRHR